MSEYNIGAKIRKLRHDRRLTLQKISTELGVSTALISQIENGHISPPIATLTKIARFFDVKMADFFSESEEPCRFEVVRAREYTARRGMMPDSGTSRAVELFSNNRYSKRLSPMLIEIPGSVRDAPGNSHAGEEFILVMEGKLAITYGSNVINLEAGDSVYFDADTVHSLLSADGSDVKLLSIVSRHG
ncbi:MAG TPA: cupin domain-containing protein [Geobacteraceae bacterium]|nr:cupin domain-containing protein [Geobacteraceae bacterium]